MGTLRFFNLQMFMEQFGCRYLFETGTGLGDSVHYASYFAFERLWSVEIHPEVAATARDRFLGNARIVILEGTSEDALTQVLPTLDRGAPVLFWLDAHFPGADFGYAGYKDEPDVDRRLPLARELDLIARLRNPCRDVVLIDDLRIYEDGVYQSGSVPPDTQTLTPEQRNLDFINRTSWSRTHDQHRFYDHTGYLVLTPKPRG